MNTKEIIIPKQIWILTIFTILLNFVYLVWSDSIFSLYIIWNIILAFIPFFISYYLLKFKKQSKHFSLICILGMILWLLFFPNAPYLVTDIIHIGESIGVPLWFDSLALFCSAWVGILLAIYSLSYIEELLESKYSKRATSFLITFFVLLSSFGIYLGRFSRWNSWDILFSPKNIFNDFFIIFSNPSAYREAYVFILFFFSFILVSFYAWKFNQKRELQK